MGAELHNPGMKVNGIATAFQNDATQIVIEQGPWQSSPIFKRMNMATQEALHALIKEELKVQRPGVGKRDYKTGKTAAGTAYGDFSKMGPVYLPLFSGKSSKPKKCFAMSRAHTGNESAQLYNAAAIASIANHLEDSGCPQGWVLSKNFTNEMSIGIRCTGTQCLGIAEPFCLNRTSDGFRVKHKFTGNGSDFPMFYIE
jgi:hypothetical protein